MIGIFILLELLLSFIMGFLNLMGLSSFITNILLLIFNIIIFTFYGYKSGKVFNKKAIISGLTTGFILTLILFIIGLILFAKNISISTAFYYLSMILICTLASITSKNKKES